MRNQKLESNNNDTRRNDDNRKENIEGGMDAFDLKLMVEPLLAWFEGNARVLPWREQPLPYYVWISEIMLQQTRVEAVKPYFDRFIKALPDVKALAECPEETYLKLWEGLGYYNRVRNLNAAAKQIMEEYGGLIPEDYGELLKLKGIGHYTAGAISSIAYGKSNPAVDGNVLRVISRLTADASDIMKQSVRTHMEDKLRQLMEETGVDPSKLNQALMELGAMVCLPNGTPHCTECPWKDICLAKKQDLIAEIPVKKKQKDRRIEKRTVFIIRDGNLVAIHKRPEKGLLAGLYELPNVEGHISQEDALSFLEEKGLRGVRIKQMQDAKHIFSHVEWHMISYQILLEDRELTHQENISETQNSERNREEMESFIWVDAESARENYAIPNAFKAYEDLYRKPIEA